MAPRRKGAFELNEVVETPKTMPLDARQLVRSKEEMLDPDSFPNGYNGMTTNERTEGKVYMLMDKDNPTQEASWKVIGPYDDSALDARVTALENAPPGEQVQANWNETDTTSKAFIQNKPVIPEAYDDTALAARVTAVEGTLANKADASSLANVATSGSYNDLGDKPSIPEAYDDTEVRGLIAAKANSADLAPVATSGSYNDLGDKPSIPEAYDDTEVRGLIAAKANSADLATVATSGSYNDLGDKPTIPAAYDDTEVRGLIAAKANSADLATVATSGSYNDLGDKPSIPEAYDDTELRGLIAAKANSADLATVATSGSYNDLGDKPSIPEAYDDTALAARVTAVENGKANTADLATVATSGSYNDLLDKPTTPPTITVDSAMSDTSENPVQNKVVLAAITDAVDVVEANVYTKAETEAYVGEQLSTLATVATSGSYDDLSDKPTIPEAYDDTALAARVTAVEDGKASLQIAAIPGGGDGDEISATVSQGTDSVNVNYYKDGALPNTLNLNVDSDQFSIPTTGYADEKAAQAQSNAQTYVDLQLTQKQNKITGGTTGQVMMKKSNTDGDIEWKNLVGSAWGVAKQGNAVFSNSAYATVSVAELGLASADDYEVVIIANDETLHISPRVTSKTTTQFQITISSALTVSVPYIVSAKGFGAANAGNVPNGGTTGQALIKQSNTDGDFDWADTGVGVHIKVGEEKWQGTYTDENGETFQVYSKMVYIPALPAAAGITTYEHGVSNIKQILNIYGFTPDGFVLNAPRQNVQDNITIYQASRSASNQTFSIEVGKDRSNKQAYVVMVYAKNN